MRRDNGRASSSEGWMAGFRCAPWRPPTRRVKVAPDRRMSDASPPPPDPGPHPRGPSTKAFATLWLTLFLDLVGFGIIIPVLPFYATSFGASPQLVTLLATAFSLAQFGAAPVLGRISDRVGRRPVMLISIAGSCASMLVLGLASALWMVFAARVLSGLCTANISTAHAYVADRIAPARRAKYMGLMGSAIGLGFVFGPALGGLLSTPEHPELPFLVSAGLAAINWGMAFVWLPESHRPERASTAEPTRAHGSSRLGAIVHALWGTPLGWLVLVNLCFFVAFSSMESTYALLLEAEFGWGAQQTGGIFAFVGVVIVLTQGVLVGRLVGRLGERRTLLLGMTLLVVALSILGSMKVPWLAFVGSALLACGNGLTTPSINALVSRSSGAGDQGFHMGLSSSAAALGRIGGPAGAGVLFARVGPGVPMLVAAGVVMMAALVVLARVRMPGGDA
ncbi:MFS transporter [Paraliomyxa miuraensis]|uniref:MFS transporter n=1 Tax=Paraliomyxa miuraensis TaxID=376150 RepID=UPI00224FAE39|nr:MFS transporter [Paraliomyxa miuraensis]MCX4246910.1 MFS transporter [Paraliomyxa miuraensis]